MIRINLMSSSDVNLKTSLVGGSAAVPGDAEQEKKLGLMKFILLIVPLVGFHYYQSGIIRSKKVKVVQMRKQLKQLKDLNQAQGGISEEISRIREEENMLRARIRVIDGLSKNRSILIKSMDAIQTLIPKRVWLDSLELGEREILLSGYAVSGNEISNFMQSLQDSIFFKNVSLKSATEAKLQRGSFKRFEVTCNLREI